MRPRDSQLFPTLEERRPCGESWDNTTEENLNSITPATRLLAAVKSGKFVLVLAIRYIKKMIIIGMKVVETSGCGAWEAPAASLWRRPVGAVRRSQPGRNLARFALAARWPGIFVVACSMLLGGCLTVARQPVPRYALTANQNDFSLAADEVAMHYYGAGGWGISWKDQYLLMAPYFSNHPLEDYGLTDSQAEVTAISAGVMNTPFSKAGLILVGHGHADHASDIPGFFSAELGADVIPSDQVGLIANGTTQNMLRELIATNIFRCEASPSEHSVAITSCNLTEFRITPLSSDHAPNMVLDAPRFGLNGLSVLGFAGHRRIDWTAADGPASPADFVTGTSWAYVIDLLDEAGDVAFRIHYMDAAAGAGNAVIPGPLLAERPIDVHIACVPGFNFVNRYPESILTTQHDVGYVFLGHWEDFFRRRDRVLRPVSPVLNEPRLNEFVRRVEARMQPGNRLVPTNKAASDCPSTPNRCGPRGTRWAMPVPGETYRFDTVPP